jgi:hypothetical protein
MQMPTQARPPRRMGLMLIVALIVGLVIIAPAVASARPASAISNQLAAAASSGTKPSCNGVGDPAPSSLYIPLPEVNANLSAGATLAMSMEIAAANYTSADQGVKLEFPTVDFAFVLSPSGSLTKTILPQTVSITGPGWLSYSSLDRTQVLTSPLSFAATSTAHLTTAKVSVMADVPYGNITVEFRWMWSMIQANGSSTNSSWSTPVQSFHHGSIDLPSIFYPAQFVSFLTGPGGGQKVTIGTNYSASVGGLVAGSYYFLEMENSTGSVVQSQGTTFPSGVTVGNVTIPVLNYDKFLTPGKYLVHIHDYCGAILYNKQISAVFATLVNITFFLQPASCGPMTFNGTAYLNDTTGNYAPSTNPYPFTVPSCKGHSFNGWSGTGAVHVSSNDHLVLSYKGTFSIVYK